MTANMRILFTTDIHGSDLCFRKFLNAGKHFGAHVMIIGGDLTGKRIVPIVQNGKRSVEAAYGGETLCLESEAAIAQFERRVSDQGCYPFRCDRTTQNLLASDSNLLDSTFESLIAGRLRQWVQLADERLRHQNREVFVNSGNDDPFFVDAILDQSDTIKRTEGRLVALHDGLTMISTGYANLTPWRCPRDIPEDALRGKVDEMAGMVSDMSKCIFNLHCPPFGTVLDRAPKLDRTLTPEVTAMGMEYCSVGSTAVREAIEFYQPCVGLHGHVHESRGMVRLGRTVCMNPGSEYQEGTLRCAILDFQNGRLKDYGLAAG